MPNPSNRDLHVMLARIEERQINLSEKINKIADWQEHHEENDTKEFKEIKASINSLYKYASSIALVATSIGATITYFFKKIKGII